jgi:hypothetical protein
MELERFAGSAGIRVPRAPSVAALNFLRRSRTRCGCGLTIGARSDAEGAAEDGATSEKVKTSPAEDSTANVPSDDNEEVTSLTQIAAGGR